MLVGYCFTGKSDKQSTLVKEIYPCNYEPPTAGFSNKFGKVVCRPQLSRIANILSSCYLEATALIILPPRCT